MLIQQLHIPLDIYYLNMFILQLLFFCCILKMKNWDNKMVRKKVRANMTQQMIHVAYIHIL